MTKPDLVIRACECGQCLAYVVVRWLDGRHFQKLGTWSPLRLG